SAPTRSSSGSSTARRPSTASAPRWRHSDEASPVDPCGASHKRCQLATCTTNSGRGGMRIVRFSTGHYRVPREVWWGERRIGASGYEISDLELVTFELETDEGVRGSGFTYTVGRGGAAVHAMLEHEVGPLL